MNLSKKAKIVWIIFSTIMIISLVVVPILSIMG